MKQRKQSNEAMAEHPELKEAMSKVVQKPRQVRRAVAMGGARGGAHPRPFEMVDTKFGAGEIIAHAIQFNDKGVNILAEDAVLVCIPRYYAKTPTAGPCIHKIVNRSETSAFDEKKYAEIEKKAREAERARAEKEEKKEAAAEVQKDE